MKYLGYTARYEIDEDDGILVGRVDGIRDVVTFEAETVRQLEVEFRRSVDVYIEFCKERGEKPERPFSGHFLVRTTPERHSAIAARAREAGLSVNAWVVEAIDSALLASASPAAPKSAAAAPARPAAKRVSRKIEQAPARPRRRKSA